MFGALAPDHRCEVLKKESPSPTDFVGRLPLQGGVVLLKGNSTRTREALHDQGTPRGPLVENAMAAN